MKAIFSLLLVCSRPITWFENDTKQCLEYLATEQHISKLTTRPPLHISPLLAPDISQVLGISAVALKMLRTIFLVGNDPSMSPDDPWSRSPGYFLSSGP